jgi:hypothetical protein
MGFIALSFEQEAKRIANVRLIIGEKYTMGVIGIRFHSNRKGKLFLKPSP